MNKNCLVCDRIKMIKNGDNPFFIREMETGFVVIGDHQTYQGYTVFLCKKHCSELHHLDTNYRNKFLSEMAIVAEAVFKAFNPDKLNYELLGNTDNHMHWHLFPRRKTDQKAHTAIWAVEKSQRSNIPTKKEFEELKSKLSIELDKLLEN